MKKLIVAAGFVALAAAFGTSTASAQGRSGGQGGGHGGGSSYMVAPGGSVSDTRGLNRADVAAGKHGERGWAKARTRGANALGFCPPGQAKKFGQGSKFAC